MTQVQAPAPRAADQLRPVRITRGYTVYAEGSVLVEFGQTKVLCTASVEEKVPPHKRGSGEGWVTAEYGMLPRATHTRGDREAARGKQSGRTQEIQRLIGRSLRAVFDLGALGERTIALVLKFYRPGRWSAAQIEEEHAFAHELMAAEVPVVGPLAIAGRTLHQHEGLWFSVSPRRGGRAPELGDAQTLAWIGRFLARLHLVGERTPFRQRPTVDLASYGDEPRAWLLQHGALPLEVEREWADLSQQALAAVASAGAPLGALGQRRAGFEMRQVDPVLKRV